MGITTITIIIIIVVIIITWVSVVAGQTRVAVPAARVAQTRETLARDVVTIARRAQVLIGVAPAGLAVVSDGQGVPVIPIGTPLTVRTLEAGYSIIIPRTAACTEQCTM